MKGDDLRKRKTSVAPLHLNVRLSGEDAMILQRLREAAPDISDSQLIRDSVRLGCYALEAELTVVPFLGIFNRG